MRVLVVEDTAALAEGLRLGLEAEGLAVDVAATGPEGLWRTQEGSYDAVVLDIMLPGMSGYAVCRAMREAGDWTPVLVLTAKDGDWDQVEALDTGADDYLTKPFSFVVLMARLRALVRRGARERPVVLTVGDLEVDPAARTVHRGGTAVDLTAREFAVLEFLARRAGEVVTKREVLAGVWDDDFEGDPNIVEVYVRHLRNKVDRPFGVETIVTLRGAGYRLEAPRG